MTIFENFPQKSENVTIYTSRLYITYKNPNISTNMVKLNAQLESAERKIQDLENGLTEKLNSITKTQGSLSNQQSQIRIKQSEFQNDIKDKITLADCKQMVEEKQYLRANDLDGKLSNYANTDSIKDLEEQISSAVTTDPIYFLAHCTSTFSNTGGTIPFQNVVEELNSGFTGSTGVMTAKIRGLYHFSFSDASGGHKPRASIMHNNIELCEAFGTSPNWETVSCSATVLLDINDTVYVKLISNKVYCSSGHPYGTFSGFLITKL